MGPRKETGACTEASAEVASGRLTPPSSSDAIAQNPSEILSSKVSDDVGHGDSLISTTSEDEDDSTCGSKVKVKIGKHERNWFKNYFLLKSYKELHGDCVVPREYSVNSRLGTWVAVQRKQYRLKLDNKPSSITEDRIDLLNELDFAWNAQEVAWDRHISDYKRFRAEYGSVNVPADHPKYPQLHLWVREQRRHYSLMMKNLKSHMTPARASKLNDINFCWDTCEAQWHERLRELTEFQNEFGHTVIPPNYEKYPKLGAWVSTQRRVYKNTKEGKPGFMPEYRVNALNALGFNWSPRS